MAGHVDPPRLGGPHTYPTHIDLTQTECPDDDSDPISLSPVKLAPMLRAWAAASLHEHGFTHAGKAAEADRV